MYPAQEANSTCDLYCFSALANTDENKIYSDLTSKSPVHSHKDNQYIFMAYIYNKNAILIQEITNREAST